MSTIEAIEYTDDLGMTHEWPVIEQDGLGVRIEKPDGEEVLVLHSRIRRDDQVEVVEAGDAV